MSAGEHLAGDLDVAGEDPPATAPAPRRVSLPRALLFDGATRTYLSDVEGRLLDVHPVDHEVALAILVELGTITSAPSTGSTLRKVKHLGGPTLRTEVAERVRTAVSRALKARDILELGLTVETPSPWALFVRFEYVNLRLADSPKRTVEATTT